MGTCCSVQLCRRGAGHHALPHRRGRVERWQLRHRHPFRRHLPKPQAPNPRVQRLAQHHVASGDSQSVHEPNQCYVLHTAQHRCTRARLLHTARSLPDPAQRKLAPGRRRPGQDTGHTACLGHTSASGQPQWRSLHAPVGRGRPRQGVKRQCLPACRHIKTSTQALPAESYLPPFPRYVSGDQPTRRRSRPARHAGTAGFPRREDGASALVMAGRPSERAGWWYTPSSRMERVHASQPGSAARSILRGRGGAAMTGRDGQRGARGEQGAPEPAHIESIEDVCVRSGALASARGAVIVGRGGGGAARTNRSGRALAICEPPRRTPAARPAPPKLS
jgi:hypothetical protein